MIERKDARPRIYIQHKSHHLSTDSSPKSHISHEDALHEEDRLMRATLLRATPIIALS